MFANNYEKIFNPEQHLYFAMKDKGEQKNISLISYNSLADYNFEQYGVFHTIHEFINQDRKNNSLKTILFWAIDIDAGTKTQMQNKISKGLKPSYIVETAKGYHIYWKAKNGTKENYTNIMQSLIEYYGADKQAKDFARLLRVAGYNHWKQDKPFLCKEISYSDISYSEEQILYWTEKNNKKNIYFLKKPMYYNNNNTEYTPKRFIVEGQRNTFLNRYGYILITKNNITGKELLDKMLNHNNQFLIPPLKEWEVKAMWGSLEKCTIKH